MNQTKEQVGVVDSGQLVELSVDTKELGKALMKLKRSIPRSPNSNEGPFVKWVKVQKEAPNTLSLTSTNLDTATRVTIGANIQSFDGPFLFPGYRMDKLLGQESGELMVTVEYEDIVTETTGEEVQCKHDLVIELAGIEYNLPIVDATQFPELPQIEEANFEGALDLNNFIDIVYTFYDFALTQKDTTRLSLTGINFADREACAVNGYHMVTQEIEALNTDFLLGSVRDLKDVRPTFKKFEGEEIRFYSTDSYWVILSDSNHTHQILIKEIEEDFPEYKGVIPVNNDLEIDIAEVRSLEKFLEKVVDLAPDDNSGPSEAVKWHIKEGRDKVLLTNSHSKGDMSTKIGLNKAPTQSMTIALKASFALNIVKNEDDVTMWLADPDTAALFDGKSGRTYVQMPISDL